MDTVVGVPPEGWTIGHFTLQLYGPEERLPVEAWRKGAFAIHERINRDGTKEAVLSHAPTGLRINSFETMDECAECAEQIEPFADWGSITKKFDTGSDLYPKVRDVVEAVKWRHDAVGNAPACGEKTPQHPGASSPLEDSGSAPASGSK